MSTTANIFPQATRQTAGNQVCQEKDTEPYPKVAGVWKSIQ